MNNLKRRLNSQILDALRGIRGDGDFAKQSEQLLEKGLGYTSTRKFSRQSGDPKKFFKQEKTTDSEDRLTSEIETIKTIFQITSDEVKDTRQGVLLEEKKSFDVNNVNDSFIFFAVKLKENDYKRADLASITRIVNQYYHRVSCVVLFKYDNKLSVGLIRRRPHERKPHKDVLLKVSLIKDIDLKNPHRAHVDILTELSLPYCLKWIENKRESKNFDGLLKAWLATLDVKELNKRFYRELRDWFEWAKKDMRFPTEEKAELKQEEWIMRLLVRILFVWFIKEKRLVAEQLFNPPDIKGLLKEFYTTPKSDSYYRAILQNLFFATLNTEIEKRTFSNLDRNAHRNFNLYRYKDQMENPDGLKELFEKTPFINGGLFDCHDDFEATGSGGRRIDYFSDNKVVWSQVSVPDYLFFAEANTGNGPKGLIYLFKSYKFTVEENTPIEQDVALDPELLGQVFEELLDEIEGDTRGGNRSNRKDTGSYYTPREVVDYMVDEALVTRLSRVGIDEDKLEYLLDYARNYDDAGYFFEPDEKKVLVEAIANLRILDPAVGSGAFPMGILNKLNLALRRLDSDNAIWKRVQIDLATEKTRKTFEGETDESMRKNQLDTINHSFAIHTESGFGRKRYLIQNCIFGVDIQPIACQIAKLRFFISLAIEQNPNSDLDNYGIQPLPNLENRFVVADALKVQKTLEPIWIELGKADRTPAKLEKIDEIQRKLQTNRELHFNASDRQYKLNLKRKNDSLRKKLAEEILLLKLKGINNEMAERAANWDPYDQNAKADWFDPTYMFGVHGGFDVVIGNPPYTGLQKNEGKLANKYQKEGFKSFDRNGGIYVLFYERGHNLLAQDGYLCYITSRQWLRARYGEKLRTYLSDKTRPLKLVDLQFKVFEASVDVNILLVGKQPIKDSKMSALTVSKLEKLKVGIKGELINIPQNGSNWLIPTKRIAVAEQSLKKKIELSGTRLKEWNIEINYGIKTGFNAAFLIDRARRQEILANCSDETERQHTEALIKPLLRGRDVGCYSVDWKGIYIIGAFPSLKLDIDRYPAIEKHLLEFGKDRLEQSGTYLPDGTRTRKKTKNRWFETQDQIAYHDEFEKEKLIWSEIVSRPQFVCDNRRVYTLDTTFIMTTSEGSLRYLCGVLNSDLGWYIFKNYYAGPGLGKDGIRYKKKFLEWLPIPLVTGANAHIANEIETLVDRIIVAKKDNVNADTKAWKHRIDEAVYRLYELKEAEIKMVEKATKAWR